MKFLRPSPLKQESRPNWSSLGIQWRRQISRHGFLMVLSPMETTSSFGYWIRRQRKALDLTQQALAERVGCSLAAIKKIEGDERRPSRQTAERIADALGISAGQRETFVEVARGLQPVVHLSLAHEPAGSASSPLEAPQPVLHNL